MPEVADVFSKYGKEYRRKYQLPNQMMKVMKAIEDCRTAKLGGHIDECDECGHIKISYNSCRNRHCPKCQSLAKERWLTDRKNDLLPVEYFHVVFTIPDTLNPLTLRNQRELYSILFKSVSETLLELGKDPKYLGVDIGFIGVLHTWGQNLMDHPHIHCIVAGGGLSLDSDRWIPARKGFFVPVKVLSRLFRGKFLAYLKGAYVDGRLKFCGSINGLGEKENFGVFLDSLYKREWVVYSKPSFRKPEHVIEYLGRYTHRVAITNNRILDIENGKVTFNYKDYKDYKEQNKHKNKHKKMTLEANEFIRRFMLHVLPPKFVKIRHYGILSNRNRKTKLKCCKELLGVSIEQVKEKKGWQELLLDLTGKDPMVCPCCKVGRLVRKEIFGPARSENIGIKKLVA
ncbi:MAG TPA: IS91 family transposase [Patescibacteria group bacterium]|nr:IS91 family transposase [Patescibacteria group bacterium]